MNVNDARSRLRTPSQTPSSSSDHVSLARPIKRPWYTRLPSVAHHSIGTRLRLFVHLIVSNVRRLVPRKFDALHLKQRLPSLTGRQWAIGLAIMIVSGLWLVLHRPPSPHTQTAAPSTSAATSATLVKENPPFPALLPSGKNAGELGGWTRISPSSKDAAYAYVDHIGTVQINVSQQILPDNFRSTPEDSLRTLAESFDARETIKAGDTTVYIGTSTKGPQSIIFAKNNLLVLIKSSGRIAEPLWTNYIKDLD